MSTVSDLKKMRNKVGAESSKGHLLSNLIEQEPWLDDAKVKEDTMNRYFVSTFTDGPATRWNVIDRQTQEWIRRFPTEQGAREYASQLEKSK